MKTTFFLLFIVSGASFLSKKLKNKNSSENLNKKHTPWIRDPEKIHPGSQIPDPGGKKAPDLGSGSATLNECMSIAELLNRKGEEVWDSISTFSGQMDPASKIFDFLYLGSEWNASNLEVGTVDSGDIKIEVNWHQYLFFKVVVPYDIEWFCGAGFGSWIPDTDPGSRSRGKKTKLKLYFLGYR